MTTKIVATAAFAGDCFDLDPDRAADELRQAGYEVHRLPDKYGGWLAHSLDDFIEAVLVFEEQDSAAVWSATDTIMEEVEVFVCKYGGCRAECGPVGPDYVPFADVFAGGRD